MRSLIRIIAPMRPVNHPSSRDRGSRARAERCLGTAIDGVIGLVAERVPHASLMERARLCRGVVRTGKYTPYANAILSIGVAF
jgi:hypothetical protein